MAYNKELLKEFLEKKEKEGWDDSDPENVLNRLKYLLIMHYIQKYLPPENSLILDIGIEPGIYAIKLAEKKRRLVIADLSETQMQLTREKFEKLKIIEQIEQFAHLGNLFDLTHFKDNTFDMVLCLSETLSFACDQRRKMLLELLRVTKNGAPLILTVKSKANYYHNLLRTSDLEKLSNPQKSGLWELFDTGYKEYEDYPNEPAAYYFTAETIYDILSKVPCEILEIGGLNVLSKFYINNLTTINENTDAWETVYNLEKKFAEESGIIDAGETIIAVIRKSME